MRWWVYKCNSNKEYYQSAFGDWDWLFIDDPLRHWGSSDWIPDLAKLKKGDMVIAYQTNRNELVGVARVRQACEKDNYLYLTPLETIRIKVRPLKKMYPVINDIPAFKAGPIKTIYDITEADAQKLIKVAKSRIQKL